MKSLSANYDYGVCQTCGEQMAEQLINQDFWIKGQLLVIEDVPAGVCPRCGEKVVRAEIGKQLAALLTDPQQTLSTRTINVPVIRFVKAA